MWNLFFWGPPIPSPDSVGYVSCYKREGWLLDNVRIAVVIHLKTRIQAILTDLFHLNWYYIVLALNLFSCIHYIFRIMLVLRPVNPSFYRFLLLSRTELQFRIQLKSTTMLTSYTQKCNQVNLQNPAAFRLQSWRKFN